MTAHKWLRFEGFTLDLDRLCLRGPSGPVELRRKNFEVLRYLVKHPGRVVTKEELIAAVWPDVTVGDESLTQCVSEIRRALGHKGQQIIRTIARRGYLVDVPISASGLAAPQSTLERFDVGASQEMTQLDQAPARRPDGPPATASAQAGDRTRRQVTSVVCSFGAAAVAGRMDPEALSEILSECHKRARGVVEAHGGFLVKKLVDGAQFLFGYPRAHEDDAERAVRAGLAVTKAARDLEFRYLAEPLQARVGIAAGLVVIGDLAGGSEVDQAVVGEAPLLASFLLDLAPPHAVMIAASTRRLIGTLFEYRNLGMVEIKQLPEPVEVSEVLRESAIGSRLEALRSVRGYLFGRGDELGLLLRRWQQAKTGEGNVVLLTGEAGIGKSRLVRALQERLAKEQHTPLIHHCSPYRQDSALHPVIAQLLRAANIERDEDAETKLEKLEAVLEPCSEDLAAEGAHPRRAASPTEATRCTDAGVDGVRGPSLDRSDVA